PPRLARWWADALSWDVIAEEDGESVIATPDRKYPGLAFLQVPDEKRVKNRLHLDWIPDDQDVEVERLLALGAHRVDIGQSPDVAWVVLADPDGNEFCILTARKGGM